MKVVSDPDEQFFHDHSDRELHIRKAGKGEKNGEFWSLGPHDPERRRIIAWKVPERHHIGAGQILRIPFLQFADETIEDTDDYLRPVLHQIMMDAAQEHGIQPPKMMRPPFGKTISWPK